MGTGSSSETPMQFRNSGCRAVGSTCNPHAYDSVVSSSTYLVKTLNRMSGCRSSFRRLKI